MTGFFQTSRPGFDTLHTYTVGQFRTVVHNVDCDMPTVVDRGFDYEATWPNFPNDRVYFAKLGSGAIIDHVVRSGNPEGSGGKMIAYALQKVGIRQPTFLQAKNVINKPTLDQLANGVDIKDTLLGKTFINAAQELGGTPTAWRVWTDRGKTFFEVTIGY